MSIKNEPTCTCPKCGHEGNVGEFNLKIPPVKFVVDNRVPPGEVYIKNPDSSLQFKVKHLGDRELIEGEMEGAVNFIMGVDPAVGSSVSVEHEGVLDEERCENCDAWAAGDHGWGICDAKDFPIPQKATKNNERCYYFEKRRVLKYVLISPRIPGECCFECGTPLESDDPCDVFVDKNGQERMPCKRCRPVMVQEKIKFLEDNKKRKDGVSERCDWCKYWNRKDEEFEARGVCMHAFAFSTQDGDDRVMHANDGCYYFEPIIDSFARVIDE